MVLAVDTSVFVDAADAGWHPGARGGAEQVSLLIATYDRIKRSFLAERNDARIANLEAAGVDHPLQEMGSDVPALSAPGDHGDGPFVVARENADNHRTPFRLEGNAVADPEIEHPFV